MYNILFSDTRGDTCLYVYIDFEILRTNNIHISCSLDKNFFDFYAHFTVADTRLCVGRTRKYMKGVHLVPTCRNGYNVLGERWGHQPNGNSIKCNLAWNIPRDYAYIYIYYVCAPGNFSRPLFLVGQVPRRGFDKITILSYDRFLESHSGRGAITYIILARTRLEDGKTLSLWDHVNLRTIKAGRSYRTDSEHSSWIWYTYIIMTLANRIGDSVVVNDKTVDIRWCGFNNGSVFLKLIKLDFLRRTIFHRYRSVCISYILNRFCINFCANAHYLVFCIITIKVYVPFIFFKLHFFKLTLLNVVLTTSNTTIKCVSLHYL